MVLVFCCATRITNVVNPLHSADVRCSLPVLTPDIDGPARRTDAIRADAPLRRLLHSKHVQVEGIEPTTNPLFWDYFIAQHSRKKMGVGQVGLNLAGINPVASHSVQMLAVI